MSALIRSLAVVCCIGWSANAGAAGNLSTPPSFQWAQEGFVVRLSTPRPEPGAATLSGVAIIALVAQRRRRRGVAIAAAACAAMLLAGAAGAQVAGTDCDCAETGAYVSPDPGVRPSASAVSPGGAFRVDGGALPGPITIRRQSDEAVVLEVQAGTWGWSPDGTRIVISLVTGTPPNQVQDYWLYDLAGASPQTPIWHLGPSALWSSTRLRFSDDGAVFLFAGLVFNSQVELQALEIATGALFSTSFSFYNPPANLDDDSNPQVAGWGFGPDPTRLAYGYTTGQDGFTRVLANVSTSVERGIPYTAIAEVPLFSPCGDVFAEKVQQLVTSGEVTVTLYSTADPHVQLASRGFADGLEVEVRSNATSHVGLLGGVEYPIGSNVADDACAPANQPPTASFTPPSAPIAGEPAAFTDASSDPDGSVVAWSWDFGDGATSSARSPSHTYANAGRYTVRLTVTDDDGATDVAEVEVSVCGNLANAAGRILFSTDAGVQGDSFNRDLFELDAASRVTAQITDSDWCRTSGTCFAQFGGSGTVSGARLSPDGGRIAFAPWTYRENGIWVMNADGSDRRRLTNGSGNTGDFHYHNDPVWSPDGAWIAFVNSDVGLPADQTGLYMIRADGTGLVHVPGTTFRNPVADKSPDFFPEISPSCAALPIEDRSPGCYRIAYIRDPYAVGTGGTIRSIRGDGSEPSVLVSEQGFYGNLRVSPDGSRLAIARDRVGVGAYSEIAVVDLADPSVTLQPITFSDQWAEYPVWSPDGQLLAYQGLAVGTTEYDLYVTDTAGCTASAMRAVAGVAERPADWKPGVVSQGPVSLSGRVYTDGFVTNGQGGIVVALSGDASATATSAADGTFFFGNLPAGGHFLLSILSAPGFVFDPTPIPIELGGHAVGAVLGVYPDQAIVSGTVRLDGAPLEGMVIRAEGPGGPFEATTDVDGRYSLTTRRDQTYTFSGLKPGYRLDPETRSVWVGAGITLDLSAIAVAELPPGRIAFTRSSEGNDEIYLLDLGTLAQTNLTNDPASDRDPAWSPGGKRIAFTSTRDGYDEIFLMDADGSNPSATGVQGYEPAWSPDGEWIAYATGGGIGLYRLATGEWWPLTFDPSDRNPTWGTAEWPGIVFERTVARDGALERDLFGYDFLLGTSPPSGFEYPVLTRAGDDLEPDLVPGAGETGFALATQDGNPANDLGVSASFPFQYADRTTPGRNPSWSPDGRFVAFDDGAGSLWLFEPGSGNPPISLTDSGASGSGADSDPDWRPAAQQPACANGIDDDGDGLADLDDPGCPLPYASPENPPCDNGLDDDGNGLSDFEDPKCTRAWPYWEDPPACGLGGELVLLYAAALRWARRVGRKSGGIGAG
jgi:Tol biopolymer transport system component